MNTKWYCEDLVLLKCRLGCYNSVCKLVLIFIHYYVLRKAKLVCPGICGGIWTVFNLL